jgi:hypothetical protein
MSSQGSDMIEQDKEIDVLEMMHKDLWLVKLSQAITKDKPTNEKQSRPYWEALELLATPSR